MFEFFNIANLNTCNFAPIEYEWAKEGQLPCDGQTIS